MPAFLNDAFLDEVQDRLRAMRPNDLLPHRVVVEDIARATIKALGLGIANDGEIYNPAPPPAHDAQKQQNIHWSGSKPRRRR